MDVKVGSWIATGNHKKTIFSINLFLELKLGPNKKVFRTKIFRTKVKILTCRWIWEFFNFSSFEKLYLQFKDLTYNLATNFSFPNSIDPLN